MIVSGRKMDPEPIQDILVSLEMTNETKKRLDDLQGWAKDLKVRVSRRRSSSLVRYFYSGVMCIFLKVSFSLLSISLSFVPCVRVLWLPRIRDDILLLD
jgi:hypothetical protein